MRYLSSDNRRGLSAPSAAGSKTAYEIAELLLLQECVQRCEELAAQAAGRARHHPILAQLSECISACENYLAAKSRESRYENRLSAFCKEVLETTAEGCRDLETDAAIRCRMACRVAIEFLEQSARTRAGLWN